MGSESWDTDSGASGEDEWGQFAWEQSDDEEPEDRELSKREMGEAFGNLLMSIKYQHRPLTSKDVCILAHFAHGAGAVGLCDKMRFRPDAPSGHFQRHLDSVFKVKRKNTFYQDVPMPVHAGFGGARVVEQRPLVPFHEEMSLQVAEDPSMATRLELMHTRNELPPSYYDSPVVLKHGRRVQPFVLYLDGVVFAKRDSLLGFFVYCIVTRKRICIVVLRKSELCKCGCRGWCTLFVVFSHIRASMDAAADGHYPLSRFDKSPFRPTEQHRQILAGTKLSAHFCMLFLKGDWAEFTSTLGFPTFSNLYSPCPLCYCPKENLVELEGFSQDSFPYPAKTVRDIVDACKRCEIRVELTKVVHIEIRKRLLYDKRKSSDAWLGRYLAEVPPVPGCEHLAVGDRLEPSFKLMDVGDGFDNLTVFPCVVWFWRRSQETLTLHNNPLWNEETGCTHERTMGVDNLHTLSLGVYAFFSQFVIHLCFSYDVWETRETTEEARIAMSVDRMEMDLKDFYRMDRKRGVKHSVEVQSVTPGMFGTKAKPCFNLKAGESNHFLPFLRWLITQHSAKLPQMDLLVQGCDSLLRIQDLTRKHPCVFPQAAILEFHNECYRHLRICELLDIHMRPKHHAFQHSSERLAPRKCLVSLFLSFFLFSLR